MRTHLIFSTLALVLALGASAQTVTVAQSGTPTFGTLQAAIDNFDPDPDTGTANVIQITDSGVYDEIITVDVPVTIEGTGASRPIIALQTNPEAAVGADCGLVMLIPTGTFNDVTLRNLICIPSTTNPPPDDLLRSSGQNLNILIDNCVVTANDGFDAPVTLDGLTEVDLTSATGIGDDCAFIGPTATPAGTGTVLTMVDTVFTHCPGDGLVCSGSNEGGYVIQDGCVFSYNGRLGIQGNSSFTVDAANDHVLVLGNKGFAGFWFAGIGSGATPVRNLNGLDVINNLSFGIEQQNAGDLPFSLSNAIIAGNQGQGLLIADVGTTGAVTISDVTIVNNTGAPIETNSVSTSPITITDSIIGGDASALNTLIHAGSGTMDITFSALQTAGNYPLASPPTSGAGGTITQTSVINDGINFSSTSDPSSANFFDIILIAGDGSPYRTADSGGAELTGGAGFVEITFTGVSDYSLYR